MKNYRLYLVRHGVTQGNLDGIYMGSGTDQPLCAQGAAQLRALAARFPYPKAETVFSSPMRRAVETVELLFPDAKDKIILADLRENAFGEFEGRKVTELVQDAHFKQWMDPAQHYTPEGGEPAAEFHKRCSDVLMGMFEFMMKSNISEAACWPSAACRAARRSFGWRTAAAVICFSAARSCGCATASWK